VLIVGCGSSPAGERLAASAARERSKSVRHTAGATAASKRQVLAAGRVRHGPRFSIAGERYVSAGRAYLGLEVSVEESERPGPAGGGRGSFAAREDAHGLFTYAIQTGCVPHRYAIVYGLLRAPADTVLVRTSSGVGALRHAAIPSSLVAGGVLVYGQLSEMPSELLLRTRSGELALRERLTGPRTVACRGGAGSSIGTIG
jgi:hypothetical protein